MTPTLARIRLNPRSRDVQRDLADAAQLHKTVMRLVPDSMGEHPRLGAGLLFRIEESSTGTDLLVQAQTALDGSRLPAGYGTTEVRDLTPMFRSLNDGRLARYRITANPTKRLHPTEEERAKGLPGGRLQTLTGDDALAWWQRRASDAGLELHTAAMTQPVNARVRDKNGGRHTLTRFDGLATVADNEALTNALLAGIGRCKSYGGGLLSLAPA